ncbi:PucR family transcriptional regulator [Cronobacter muytjensii]
MSLTVREILALEGLNALRLRAGDAGLHRPVRWYYVAENEGIAEWVMGGELVFITGINHPRDEANLLRLLEEGKQSGIAGMVILTGEAFIHTIPPAVIALAQTLGIALIEQPYHLKMVIVTELIGTALVRRETELRSRRDILQQLLTGDYPDLALLGQRAQHQQLDIAASVRVVALRLHGAPALFQKLPAGHAEGALQHARRQARQQLEAALSQRRNPWPLLEVGERLILLLPDGDDFSAQQAWLKEWLDARRFPAPLALLGGISGPVSAPQQYARALSQARKALDIAESLQPRQRLCDYQQLGFIRLLSAINDPGLLNDFFQQTLGALVEPGRKSPSLLLETLDAVLQENSNLIKAARRLNIHRNTLHQRLQRIEKQTGYPVDNPQFRLNASAALVIWRMSQSHLQEPL